VSPKPGALPLALLISPKARGGAPGFINIAPLGLKTRGGAHFYINIAPLGLKARGVAPGFINIAQSQGRCPWLY